VAKIISWLCFNLIGFWVPSPSWAQERVLWEVKVPVSSPAVDELYLATDFNEWNPKDPQWKLRKWNDSTFTLEVPSQYIPFSFKFTQGSWGRTEGTERGEPIPNRRFDPVSLVNAYTFRVAGWEQHHAYKFVVQQVPKNTPTGSELFISGNFNHWDPANPSYKLIKRMDGLWETTVYTDLPKLEYKFTRGNWASVEARENGKARTNRVFMSDSSVYFQEIPIQIAGWEDLMSVFHLFSLVDLLLLFSVFQGLLLLVAIPTIQSSNRDALAWLLGSLAISALFTGIYIVTNYHEAANRAPKILLLSDFIIFLYSPFYYFYLRKLFFHSPELPSKWYGHFLPFLVQVVVYMPFLWMDSGQLLNDFMNQSPVLMTLFVVSGFLGFFWNAYYWSLFQRMIQQYQEGFQRNFSSDANISYLQTVSWIQAGCLVVWGLFFVLLGISQLTTWDMSSVLENAIDSVWVLFAVIPFFIGYFAIHQPETFKVNPSVVSIFDDVLDTTPESTQEEAVLSEEDQIWMEKIDKYMHKSRCFINPKLSLAELSNQLKLPTHVVSKIINDGYQKNFFDFVNSYRIEEFKKLLHENKNAQFTLLSLAYDVGFNSKTAFNRSFKKITDQTPREYVESLKSAQT